MNETNQEVEVVKNAGLPSIGSLGAGHEEALDPDDIEFPRAKVVQFTSEEATTADEKARIAPGRFINGTSKVEISPIFIPIYKYKTYTQWNPRKADDPNYDPAYEKGALVFSTHDRHDPRVMAGINFGPKGEAPKVQQTINVFCLIQGNEIPLLLSFSKSSYRGAKRLNTMLLEAGLADKKAGLAGDIFANKFKLEFSQQENAGTKYYVMNVVAAGKSSAEEQNTARTWFKFFQNKAVSDLAAQVKTDATQEKFED